VTPIPASFAVITDADKAAMRSVVDSGWLTAGPVNRAFEKSLADFTGIKNVRTCNSGSSANLLAVAAMIEAGIWEKGDEIITSACCFPTTVNPLLLYGLVPVFVDIELGNYNVSLESVGQAIGPKTRGIMLAHTLGNPFDRDIRLKFGLPMIEDICDSLGSTYLDNVGDGYHVGKHALISTCSFFPAHHITCGEGGAVFSQDSGMTKILESVRDWGRDCYCEPGKENTCGKRFEQQFGALPYGYDHKYTYSALGFNLKITEVQAACGLSQMGRLDEFISTRRKNHAFLVARLSGLADRIVLPRATEGTNPSWFGFAITIKEPGQRTALQQYLDSYKIGSRLLFCGNVTKQPYMAGRSFRVSGTLGNSDKVMNDSLWVGCHPHLTEEQLEFMCSKIEDFFG
jgi:CDP-6-deoxy-D-xylo-4-hexulose-3-dehydrase